MRVAGNKGLPALATDRGFRSSAAARPVFITADWAESETGRDSRLWPWSAVHYELEAPLRRNPGRQVLLHAFLAADGHDEVFEAHDAR